MLISLGLLWDERGDGIKVTRSFLGETNRHEDTLEDILVSPMCPKRGDVDDFNTLRVLTDVTAERHYKEGPGTWWRITTTSEFPPASEPNPLNLPADIDVSTTTVEAWSCIDTETNQPITNSAGDLLWFPIEDTRLIFTVTKNLDVLPGWTLDYAGCINDGPVTVKGIPCEKGTLMYKGLANPPTKRTKVNGLEITYEELKYQLHHRREGWKGIHPDVGFNEIVTTSHPEPDDVVVGRYKVTSGGKVQYIRSKVKRRILVGYPPQAPTEPQCLDEQGAHIPNPQPSDYRLIKKYTHRLVSFAPLPLQ
jgi:hypothetical protein